MTKEKTKGEQLTTGNMGVEKEEDMGYGEAMKKLEAVEVIQEEDKKVAMIKEGDIEVEIQVETKGKEVMQVVEKEEVGGTEGEVDRGVLEVPVKRVALLRVIVVKIEVVVIEAVGDSLGVVGQDKEGIKEVTIQMVVKLGQGVGPEVMGAVGQDPRQVGRGVEEVIDLEAVQTLEMVADNQAVVHGVLEVQGVVPEGLMVVLGVVQVEVEVVHTEVLEMVNDQVEEEVVLYRVEGRGRMELETKVGMELETKVGMEFETRVGMELETRVGMEV